MKRIWLLGILLWFVISPAVAATIDRLWSIKPDALASVFPQLLIPGEYLFQECKQVEADFFACSLAISASISLSVMSASGASNTDGVILNCICEFPAYSRYAFKLMHAATGMEEAQLETFWRELGEKNIVVINQMVFSVYRENGAYVLMIVLKS
ncbi:hypothetical protein [Rhizobium herbae]